MRRPFRLVEAFNTGRSYTAAGQRIAFVAVNGGVYFRDIDRNIDGYYADTEPTQYALMRSYDDSSCRREYRPPLYDVNKMEQERWEAARREFREMEQVLLEAAESLGESAGPAYVKIVRLPMMDVRIPVNYHPCQPILASVVSKRTARGADYDEQLDVALDAVESLVLAHACEGVEIWKARYDRGVATTIETLHNKLL